MYRAAYTIVIIVVLFGALSILRPYLYEDIVLLVSPSAQKALEYGQLHFNAMDINVYDIERAETLFLRAYEYDAHLPLVRHEMSRIQFLKGDLERAEYLASQELVVNPDPSPSTYYIRALTYGYLQKYTDAARDYEKYFSLSPANWGSINDYAWVLIKAGHPEAALEALSWGLNEWPGNPWLLHNKVIALYELGRRDDAEEAAGEARVALESVTEKDWLQAYPGNDPRSASAGLATFRSAVEYNLKLAQEERQ